MLLNPESGPDDFCSVNFVARFSSLDFASSLFLAAEKKASRLCSEFCCPSACMRPRRSNITDAKNEFAAG